jgi:ATP-dependent DNA helicase RecG
MPTTYVGFEHLIVDGKHVIYGYIPESHEAHSYKGRFYDRNQDGDFVLRGTEIIANLFIRKGMFKTEERPCPECSMKDLDEESFDKLRSLVRADKADHPWLDMSDEEILRSGKLLCEHEGKECLNLAAILLLGTELAIARILPWYRTDVLCRIRDTELYDDRLQLRCNLISSYQLIMDFIDKHMSEAPYIENMQRFSLRDKILREVVLNLLIHREFSSGFKATLTIYRDRVETENWNLPYQYGNITPTNLRPHAKNPIIANVFAQTSLVEELGSGTRKIFKYTPIYAHGKQAEIIDADIFKIIVPHDDVVAITKSTDETINETLNETLNETIKSVLIQIKENPQITQRELCDILGKSRATITRAVRELQESGMLIRIGGRKNGHWEVTES